MSQQHQKWIQLVKDKLNTEGMTQTHLARACGVKKPTISDLLKYGKGSNKLKNRVCDVLGIDETWVELGEQNMNNAAQKVTRIDKDAWEIATELANEYGVSICHIISESVRYCAENAEFKEMDVVVKRLVVGSKVLEQEGKMEELVWFYFTIIINIVIGFATYYASKRDRKKRIDEYKKIQDDELERVRKKFNL